MNRNIVKIALVLLGLVGVGYLLYLVRPIPAIPQNVSEKDAMVTAPINDASDIKENETIVNISKTKSMEQPKMQIDKKKAYTAKLITTKGDIVIELTADKTPITVNNFIALAKQGFYDGTTFHRVIDGFMIQGGDPDGDGTGGPGYTFDDEPFEGKYVRGVVAMANSGPNTNGSQFFITTAKTPWLNGHHTIFGNVVSGYEVVKKIENVSTSSGDKPVEEQKILKAYLK